MIGYKNVKCVIFLYFFLSERKYTYHIKSESFLTPNIIILSVPFPSSFSPSLRVLLTFLKLSVP